MGEGTAVAGSSKKRGVAAGLGLGAASLLATQSAEAAQQVADLAASDSRVGILAGLALPAIGWVLFNILGERCLWRTALPCLVVLAPRTQLNAGGCMAICCS
jgi:hypothetical protein